MLLRTSRGLFFIICVCALPLSAQRLTAADSTEILELTAAAVRKHHPSLVTGAFVRDTLRGASGPVSLRLMALIRDGDTAVAPPPTRTTPRVSISGLGVAGDTVTITVSELHCREGTGFGSYWGVTSFHQYVRAGSKWVSANRLIEQGDGSTCPW